MTILAAENVRAPLTQAQFDAAELQVCREISARTRAADRSAFDPEELRLLDFFVERSFRLGRTAAYFPSYRQLGSVTRTFSHAHEALKRLIEKKVLAPLPLSTMQLPAEMRRNAQGTGHWYGFNLTFADWPSERKRPTEFWEEPSLPFEPELDEMLRETFIENVRVPCGGTNMAETQPSEATSIRGRGAAVPSRGTEANSERQKSLGLWEQVEHQIAMDNIKSGRQDPIQGTGVGRTPVRYADATAKVYPDQDSAPTGSGQNINVEAGFVHDVPPQGTSPLKSFKSLQIKSHEGLKSQSDLKNRLIEFEGSQNDDEVRNLLCAILGDSTGTRDAKKWINRMRINKELVSTTFAALVERMTRETLEPIRKPGAIAESYWKQLNPLGEPTQALIVPRPANYEPQTLDCEVPANFPTTEEEALRQCGSISSIVSKDFIVLAWNTATSRGGRNAKNEEILSFAYYAFSDWNFTKNHRKSWI